jgi:hypothetical protein
MELILIVVLILFLVGALPAWPYASNWGYGPAGLIVVIILIVLLFRLI